MCAAGTTQVHAVGPVRAGRRFQSNHTIECLISEAKSSSAPCDSEKLVRRDGSAARDSRRRDASAVGAAGARFQTSRYPHCVLNRQMRSAGPAQQCKQADELESRRQPGATAAFTRRWQPDTTEIFTISCANVIVSRWNRIAASTTCSAAALCFNEKTCDTQKAAAAAVSIDTRRNRY